MRKESGYCKLKISQAYIEITNLCNLNCRSCYNRSGLTKKVVEIPLEVLSKSVDKLINDFGCEHITISGGEPTLHSEFEKILDYIEALPITATIITNGTTNCSLLTERYTNNAKFEIQVSLDGSCEEINCHTRGKGNFDKAISFIKSINGTRTPALKMVVSQKNIDDVPDLYRLALELNCHPGVSFVSPIGNASNNKEEIELTPKQKLQLLRTINKLNKESNFETQLPRCSAHCPLSMPELDMSVLIKPNGDIHPCQMLYHDKYCMGNIFADDKQTILQTAKHITDIAQMRVETDFNCGKCIVKNYCKKGCIAYAEMNTGSPLGNDGECEYRKLQFLGFDLIENNLIK